MNVHEYQAKEIWLSQSHCSKRYNSFYTDQAVKAAIKLTEDTGTKIHVVKAQVHEEEERRWN